MDKICLFFAVFCFDYIDFSFSFIKKKKSRLSVGKPTNIPISFYKVKQKLLKGQKGIHSRFQIFTKYSNHPDCYWNH